MGPQEGADFRLDPLLTYFYLSCLFSLSTVGLYFCFSKLTDQNIFIILYGVTSIYFAVSHTHTHTHARTHTHTHTRTHTQTHTQRSEFTPKLRPPPGSDGSTDAGAGSCHVHPLWHRRLLHLVHIHEKPGPLRGDPQQEGEEGRPLVPCQERDCRVHCSVDDLPAGDLHLPLYLGHQRGVLISLHRPCRLSTRRIQNHLRRLQRGQFRVLCFKK